MTTFTDLCLIQPLLRALEDEGYQEPTDIQQAAIPHALRGSDILGIAQTGTGKTAAFALPVLQMLSKQELRPGAPRVLVLAPTRELALQVTESFKNYGRYLKLRSSVVLGGVPEGSQIAALRRQPEILVATPGRLLDFLARRIVQLTNVDILIIDEADRMLDMGFLPDVRRIAAAAKSRRQTLLFSATMPPEIADLAAGLLREPTRVEAAPAASLSENVTQKVLFVEQAKKRAALSEILKSKKVRRALVFTRTKHHADRIVKQLKTDGIRSSAIHANKSQNARQRALADFTDGRIRVLVATDILSRGIDVEAVSHVINYELPGDPETYVHRIGRTARAGAEGVALSLCDTTEVGRLRGIEKLTRIPIAADIDHPFHFQPAAAMYETEQRESRTSRSSAPSRRTGSRRGPGSRRRRPAERRGSNGSAGSLSVL